MRFLKSTAVAAAVAAASALAAAPAHAQAPNLNKPVGPIVHPVGPITAGSCPADGTLTLYKTADRSSYNVNDVVTFTLKVAAGTCDATGVAVTDQLPTGLTVSNSSVLSHSFGSVAAGTDQSYSFQAVAVAKGTWTNQAQATGSSFGYTPPGPPCGPVILTPKTSGNQANSIVYRPYHCPRSSNAQATVTVNAPGGNNPTPTPPPPGQPNGQPTGPATPQLPDTGRQQ